MAKKVELALIGSRPRAFQRANVYVTPNSPKECHRWLKTRIFTFGVAFHFFVAGNRRYFKLNMWIAHSKSQHTDDKTSLKGAWSRHVTHFKYLAPPKISLERLKLETSNLVRMLMIVSPSLQATNCP